MALPFEKNNYYYYYELPLLQQNYSLCHLLVIE